MTQSGRGEEPSARPAREGIVLPSDGGEPLLPGMAGTAQPTSVPATPPTAPEPSAPPGGQSWGNPWGPEQNPAAPQAEPGQSWGAQPGQSWGPPEQQQQYQSPSPAPWGAAPEAAGGVPPQPLPQEGMAYGGPASAPSYGQGTAPSAPAYGHGAPGSAQGAPSYGHDAQGGSYGAGAPMPAPQPSYGQGGVPSAALPSEGQHGPGALPPAAGETYGAPHAPQPPAASQGFGAPLPPADEGATQYIPPVAAAPAGADNQATQYIPPVAAPPADEGATQFIPPVGPGALPPEVSSESTQVLGRARQPGGAGPMPPASGGDADATQFIPPVSGQPGPVPQGGQQRQPLSDFDNLFRSEPAAGAAPATQHLPRIQPQSSHDQGYFPPGSHGGHGGHGGHGMGGDDDGRGGRGGGTGSRLPLIAAVGIGIAVLGIGAGALLASGGGDEQKSDDNKPVSATAPASEGSASPSADPAEQQAVALDKLLASSGDSRTAVINAVADVKSCDNLGQAAQDLRGAAKQRTQLVTDLSELSVDQLANHAALTTALTKAWQASASADNHYAAWADQVAGNKKLCRKGQARSTGQTQAGNRDSGTASEQKKTAAQLWNSIAEKYGLTQRQPTQL
ncbi:hypothetical protein [Streptomyces sp. NPDC093568]|uniref:hypothetical protein n=1 Tax=Streptomyces sp. NPDC093568 TaxID=3366041 RepID=UPI003830BC6E